MPGQTITREQVIHVARLARLALSDDEVERMTSELRDILTYVELLGELDTTGVEPTAQVGVIGLTLRDDAAAEGLDRAVVLAQAPSADHDGFVVPSFLDE